MTQKQFRQEHMPLVQLAVAGEVNGGHVYCDYCADDAVWFHWSEKYSRSRHAVKRDAYACNQHVRWLNKNYAFAAE